MNKNISIQVKAAFLLIVFALNTVLGFACSIGLDMGFNTKHHTDVSATNEEVHVHKDGKKHTHQHGKGKSHQHSHQHKQTSNHLSLGSQFKELGSQNDCCSNGVNSFQQLDKSVPSDNNILSPVFLVAFAATFYHVNLLATGKVVKATKPFVRSHHPPIPDIRIAIQSFQI